MNLVGKIFTVLIFVMSLVFMAFAVMNYATFTNYKLLVDNPTKTVEHDLGLTQQLTNAKKTLQDETQKNLEVNGELQRELAEKRQALGMLEEKNHQLREKHQQDSKLIEDKTAEAEKSAAALAATEQNMTETSKHNEVLETSLKAAHEELDAKTKQVFDLTTELHNRVDELTQLKERNVQLAADFAKAQEALRWFGINYKTDYKAKQPPHPLEGVVLDVRQQNLVEISIGADDGLRKGHKLEVMRTGGGYVGRLEVTQTTPDRAVCRVLPDMLRSPMQRGDRVFDKLD
jgi:myosin heavy subunit